MKCLKESIFLAQHMHFTMNTGQLNSKQYFYHRGNMATNPHPWFKRKVENQYSIDFIASAKELKKKKTYFFNI